MLVLDWKAKLNFSTNFDFYILDFTKAFERSYFCKRLGVKNLNCVAALELKQKIVICLLVTSVTANSCCNGRFIKEAT